LEIKLK